MITPPRQSLRFASGTQPTAELVVMWTQVLIMEMVYRKLRTLLTGECLGNFGYSQDVRCNYPALFWEKGLYIGKLASVPVWKCINTHRIA